MAGISLPYGAKLWGWAKWPRKRQMRKKHLLWGHMLTPNCFFWVIVREIVSICLVCAGAQENKAGKNERRSHKKCTFHLCVERPLAGGFQPNLAHVFVSRTLSDVQSFIVITWEVSELSGVDFSLLPEGTQTILNTLRYRAAGDNDRKSINLSWRTCKQYFQFTTANDFIFHFKNV